MEKAGGVMRPHGPATHFDPPALHLGTSIRGLGDRAGHRVRGRHWEVLPETGTALGDEDSTCSQTSGFCGENLVANLVFQFPTPAVCSDDVATAVT